ncbi:unnamed protein product [Dibothriocephalus latus]|uniref:Uncharacterized protein n=1 Tax=Dibothriocephalus latus TaxID=60516 RepID=A0A3P6TLB4_DIBLA|nr:unnamed protein product [Dibothriocephalus latus]
MDSKDHMKLKIGLEGKFSDYKINLRDDTKCLELKGKREKVFHFLDFYRIELTEQEVLFVHICHMIDSDESLSVTSEAIGQIVEDETCGQLDSKDSQPMDLPLAPTLKNYFWDIKLKNSDLESLEKGLPILKANGQIRYFKLFDASKFMSDNVPLLMVAASSLSSSTVIDLSGATIDEALLKVLPVSFKINKSLRGLTVTDPQVDGGLISDSFKFLSPFSVLRLLDVSHKSKNEKDKHEESAIISLAANTAKNLVEFRIANQNLSEEDVSNLTAGFRSSPENVAVNTLPLISLCLSGNRIKIADLAFLINNSPHLRDLQLDDCQLNVFQVMHTLETAKCKKLEQLSLMRNKFGDKPPSDCKSFGHLKNLENLRVLNLSRCQGKLAAPVIGSIWTVLEETQSVQCNCTLAIVDCGLSDGDVKYLKSHLSNPSRIRNLDMGGNRMF